ncbi:hypothetical protein VV867_22325 [Pseudomonas sp. JH-2]|uniref:hypothetical protein n=1 Tax=Pseudomonas sp. JH-2 TaxID=3114998 RepID=UPI002E26BCC2|nr:hypothetical protein [Pseudomonas sp. JH-2]
MRRQFLFPLATLIILALGTAACSSQDCTPGQQTDSKDRTSRQQIPRQQIDPRVQSLPRY